MCPCDLKAVQYSLSLQPCAHFTHKSCNPILDSDIKTAISYCNDGVEKPFPVV